MIAFIGRFWRHYGTYRRACIDRPLLSAIAVAWKGPTVGRPWTVDRDGRVRTNKDRPVELRAGAVSADCRFCGAPDNGGAIPQLHSRACPFWRVALP